MKNVTDTLGSTAVAEGYYEQAPKEKWDWLYAPSIIGLIVAFVFLALNRTDPQNVTVVAAGGAVLLGLGTFLVVLLHVIEKGKVPLNRFVSDYALSRRFGWIMNTAFVFLGLSGVVLGSCLAKQVDPPYIGWTLALAGTCITALSIFTTKSALRVLGGKPEGWFHDVFVTIGFGFVLVTMGWLALTPTSFGSVQWAHAVGTSQLNVSLIAIVAQVVVSLNRRRARDSNSPAVGQGLCERAVILLLIEWEAFLCWLLIFGLAPKL